MWLVLLATGQPVKDDVSWWWWDAFFFFSYPIFYNPVSRKSGEPDSTSNENTLSKRIKRVPNGQRKLNSSHAAKEKKSALTVLHTIYSHQLATGKEIQSIQTKCTKFHRSLANEKQRRKRIMSLAGLSVRTIRSHLRPARPSAAHVGLLPASSPSWLRSKLSPALHSAISDQIRSTYTTWSSGPQRHAGIP